MVELANRFGGRRLTVAALSFAAIVPAAAACGQCEYTILHTVPLGPTCGPVTYSPAIEAIADNGTVCGGMRAGISCPEKPFVWSPGQPAVTFLPLPPGMITGRAVDLNENGVVVGFVTAIDESSHPCWWVNGVAALLPIPAGFTAGFAEAVNSSGVVAGYVHSDNGLRAFVWTNGVGQDLHPVVPAKHESSLALDINDSGVVVGYVTGPQRAAIWQNGSVTILPPINGGITSEGVAVNNRGDVVGIGYLGPPGDPGFAKLSFIWRGVTMTDFGLLSGFGECVVNDINDLGRAVGLCNVPPPSRGFIWSSGTLSQAVVVGVPPIQSVRAINNSGLLTTTGGRILAPLPLPPFDIDQNCAVNINDLLEVINGWGMSGVAADCTEDGIVDAQDLVLVLTNWGQ